MEPHPFPEWMEMVMEKYMPLCGLERREWPDCCNLNLYEHGGHSVAWHADDERLFQGKFEDICILSLSLGEERTFSLKYVYPEDHESSANPRDNYFSNFQMP